MNFEEPDRILLLRRFRFEGVNAVSSPHTWGFPAPSAWIGFADALSRKLAIPDLRIGGIGVVCHAFTPHVFVPSGRPHAVFCLTRNPLNELGKTLGIVEEGKASLEVSFVLGLSGAAVDGNEVKLAQAIHDAATQLRFAGGSPVGALGVSRYDIVSASSDMPTQRRTLRRLLPGFALVSREQALADRAAEIAAESGNEDAMHALIDFARINHVCEESGDQVTWSVRKSPGWLVPIPAGYRGISQLYDPGTVRNVRDKTVPFRFVESVFTLGQWLSPHGVQNIQDLLWSPKYDDENAMYVASTPAYAGRPLSDHQAKVG